MSLFSAAIGFAATDTPAPTETPAAGPDWLMIGLIVVLAVMVFFMFRNSRKRKQEQEKMAAQMVPGVEVMTNFGLFGTLRSVDELANTAEVEISPGNVVKVHRQTLAKVVDPTAASVEPGAPRSVEEAAAMAEAEQQAREGKPAEEPKFGERIDDEGDQKKN